MPVACSAAVLVNQQSTGRGEQHQLEGRARNPVQERIEGGEPVDERHDLPLPSPFCCHSRRESAVVLAVALVVIPEGDLLLTHQNVPI